MECSQIRQVRTSSLPLSALSVSTAEQERMQIVQTHLAGDPNFWLGLNEPLDGGSKEWWYISCWKEHSTEAVKDGAWCSVVLSPPKCFCFLSLRCMTVTEELAAGLQYWKMKLRLVSQWKCETGMDPIICLSVEFFVLLFVVSRLFSLVAQFFNA